MRIPGWLKTVVALGFLVGLLVVMVWLAFNLGGNSGANAIEIGKSTTYVTTQRRASGRVDYAGYINEKLSAGVTPRQNAVVHLLKLGPLHGVPKDRLDEWCRLLKVDRHDLNAERFEDSDAEIHRLISQFEKRPEIRGPNQESKVNAYRELVLGCYSKPWSDAQFPELAEWISNYSRELDHIVKASQCRHYYAPLVVGENGALHSVLVPVSQAMRQYAMSLALRSMRRLHQGEIAGCQSDLLAIRRLGALVSKGPWMVDQLVSVSVFRVVRHAELSMLRSPKVTVDQLEDYLGLLEQMPQRNEFRTSVGLYERILMLDSVCRIAVFGSSALDGAFHGSAQRDDSSANAWFKDMAISMIDWNTVLREINKFFDEVESMVDGNDFRKQLGKLHRLEDRIKELANESMETSNVAWTVIGGRVAKGRLAAKYLIVNLAPVFPALLQSQYDDVVQEKLIRIHLAVEIHRRVEGRYPARLQQLKDISTARLCDPYSDQKFRYVLQEREVNHGEPHDGNAEKDVLIYSVGPNGKDEGGQTRFDQPSGDDVTVRIFRSN